MPVRRMRRKQVPKRKRFARRRVAYPRRKIAGRIHMIKRLAQDIVIKNDPSLGQPLIVESGLGSFTQTSPITGTLPGTWDFTMASKYQLASVLQLSDLTNMYDRYKIVGVKLQIHYLCNTAIAQDVSNITQRSNLPVLYYAFDGDDASDNTDVQIRQKGYCKSVVLNANRPLSLYFKPRVNKELNTGTATGLSSEKAPFIDCNSSFVAHFGMKFSIKDWVGGDGINNALRITPTYYLAMADTN